MFSLFKKRGRERKVVYYRYLRHPEKFQYEPSKFLQVGNGNESAMERVTIASKFDLSAG